MAAMPTLLVTIDLSSGDTDCSLKRNHFGTCRYPSYQTKKLRKRATMEYFGFLHLSLVPFSVYYQRRYIKGLETASRNLLYNCILYFIQI